MLFKVFTKRKHMREAKIYNIRRWKYGEKIVSQLGQEIVLFRINIFRIRDVLVAKKWDIESNVEIIETL